MPQWKGLCHAIRSENFKIQVLPTLPTNLKSTDPWQAIGVESWHQTYLFLEVNQHIPSLEWLGQTVTRVLKSRDVLKQKTLLLHQHLNILCTKFYVPDASQQPFHWAYANRGRRVVAQNQLVSPCCTGGDTWRIWLSMSFWNQFLGASEHIVLEFFKHLLCLSGAIHHWSVIAYPTNFVACAALGVRYGQISWQAQHLEHVMIALMWPAQHFQQLRIILRGRRSTWSTLWFFCVASAAFSAAKDHFAWQAQHLKHVMIKKWHAAVGKPAIVTCFARLKKLK